MTAAKRLSAARTIDAIEGPDVHDGVDYGNVTGAPYDDHFVFESSHGTIRIQSMAKGKNPPPFKMMKAEATKNYSAMTLLVLEAKAGKDWPKIEAVLEQLDEDEFKAFSQGWAEHSGMSPGE